LIHHSAHPQLPLSFNPGLKPTCFTHPTPRSFTSSFQTPFTNYCPDRVFSATRFMFLVSRYLFAALPCARLSCPSRQLFSSRKYTVSYRIVLRSTLGGSVENRSGAKRSRYITETIQDAAIQSRHESLMESHK